MCRRENIVHLFRTFYLKIFKCFEKIKDGKEPVSIKVNKKLPFKLQSDLYPHLSLTSRETAKYIHQVFCHQKNHPEEPPCEGAHRWRSRHSHSSLCAWRAGSTFLCFQLQICPWHTHTSAHCPAHQHLEV